jgi:crotonobetainyl-CoA:carnitine CoA-transferase CaiB-like acyl-CoA transferase
LRETCALLQRFGVACAPVQGADALVDDEHLAARQLFQEVWHPIWGVRRTTGLPWRLDGEGPVPIAAAPILGEYSASAIANT